MSFAGFFLKFGKAQHILDLQQQGLLFFNPISYFTKVEDEQLRGDKLEDVTEINYIGDARIDLKQVSAPDSEYKWMNAFNVTMFKRPETPIGNLFCLYVIDVFNQPQDSKITVPKKMLDFGNFCLFIHNPHEFMRRVRAKLLELNLSFAHDMVEYRDLKRHKGRKTVFQKDLNYSYQQEFRIFIENKIDSSVSIKVGDLSDISSICHTEHIGKLEILVKEKVANKVNTVCNLNFKSTKVFMPIKRPSNFTRKINGLDIDFELDVEQIQTVYIVKVKNHKFSMTVNGEQLSIEGEVPEWIKHLEADLGALIVDELNA
jgi:hypothetical protein